MPHSRGKHCSEAGLGDWEGGMTVSGSSIEKMGSYKHIEASTPACQHPLPNGGHAASPRALKTWREIPFRNCPDFVFEIQTTSLVIPGDLIHAF